MNFDACVEREEPRLGDGWDLGSILHVEKNESRALAVIFGKMDIFQLQSRPSCFFTSTALTVLVCLPRASRNFIKALFCRVSSNFPIEVVDLG